MQELTLEMIKNMSWPPPTKNYIQREFQEAVLHSQRKAVSKWDIPFLWLYFDNENLRFFLDDVGPFWYYEVRHKVSGMLLAFWFVPKGELLKDIVEGGSGGPDI